MCIKGVFGISQSKSGIAYSIKCRGIFPYHQWFNYNIDESIIALFCFHLNLIQTFIAWPPKYQTLSIHSHACQMNKTVAKQHN